MENNFWNNLPKPFFALAPLANVTDAAFRRIIAKYGKPDIMWTEFVSADGLMSPGRDMLLKDLIFTEAERPIVAQLFTAHPDKMRLATKLVAELGFDGIDINMGCPDRAVEKQGAGAALIKTPALAKEVIRAAKEGIKLAGREIPVSVKTRVGYKKREIDRWIPALLEEDIAALTIHARTREEMSKVPARWEDVRQVVELRDSLGKTTLIIGNGDVKDLVEAQQRVSETGADGIMLGRAIFGNPWLFANLIRARRGNQIEHPEQSEGRMLSIKERLEVMVEHTKLFEELFSGVKSFSVMKKHYKAYADGFPGAKDLRARLMETKNASEVIEIVNDFLSS